MLFFVYRSCPRTIISFDSYAASLRSSIIISPFLQDVETEAQIGTKATQYMVGLGFISGYVT